jgi:hypothetical protein
MQLGLKGACTGGQRASCRRHPARGTGTYGFATCPWPSFQLAGRSPACPGRGQLMADRGLRCAAACSAVVSSGSDASTLASFECVVAYRVIVADPSTPCDLPRRRASSSRPNAAHSLSSMDGEASTELMADFTSADRTARTTSSLASVTTNQMVSSRTAAFEAAKPLLTTRASMSTSRATRNARQTGPDAERSPRYASRRMIRFASDS